MKMRQLMGTLAVGVLALFASGCGQVVPPGNTCMKLSSDGSMEVVSQGIVIAWFRDRLYLVDTKIKSYEKSVSVLCSDQIPMDISLKWLGSFKSDKESLMVIKEKVHPSPQGDSNFSCNGYISLDDFFEAVLADILSSVGRDSVSLLKSEAVNAARETLREDIKKKFIIRMTEMKMPVETSDVMMTKLDYPPDIKAKLSRVKEAELQDLQNAAEAKANVSKAQQDAAVAAERGKALLVEANAKAAANYIISESLTSEILTIRQYDVLSDIAMGPNNMAVIIPFEAMRAGMGQSTLDMMNQRTIVDKLPDSPERKARIAAAKAEAEKAMAGAVLKRTEPRTLIGPADGDKPDAVAVPTVPPAAPVAK